ncbi:ethylene receptor 4-like [Triticum dicoccoides]|uniref:ethylene receptor 4-like n=1 Tax=Triticum dicoccoides TaxID=85692 RepID=UPI0018916770|nr:ethylene receptor 4-like [Triticum dicoccoides]
MDYQKMRRCGEGCDGAVDAMLQCQKVSDFLIAASYLSIPLELLYFASCADLAPVKWLLLQLAAFAVLGGAVHLLAVLTHHHPHSSGLLLASTAAKLLAALVSLATALSLLTFIPRLIRAKLREALLRAKARQLDRDVGLIRRRVEATSRVVRMLSRHIRDSPHDHHAVLHTTMLHLADALALHSCAVWVPVPGDVLQLVYQLSLRDKGAVMLGSRAPIPALDPDVVDVMSGVAAKVLRPGSALAAASGGGLQPPGGVAAIRMPMLKVSNFDGARTPEARPYAILVLVLPDTGRWSSQDLEIVEVVADQVAVALSHAAVLEEWQSIRDRLADQHRALLHAKHEAATATTGIHSVQSAMCGAMQRQMHSVIGLLSMLQHAAADGMSPEQRLVVDAIARTSALSLALANDADAETLTTSRVPFGLHALVREAMAVARCMSGCSGVEFSYHSENSLPLPEWVVGDETRVFHLLLHMVTTLLGRRCDGAAPGRITFSVESCNVGEEERYSRDWIPMRPSAGCSMRVKFQVGMQTKFARRSAASDRGLSFGMCNKIVQMMNGSMRSSGSDGGSIITVVLQFQLQQSGARRRTSSPPVPVPRFDGLRVLLADSDGTSRQVTGVLLEKLGCQVMPVPSGVHCLRLLESAGSCFQLVLLDLDKHATAATMEDVFEVALRIGELGSGGWQLVLAALAVGDVDDRVREVCQRSGINGVIQKPITLVALGAQLAAALQNN